MVINNDRNINKEKVTYSDITGAVTGRGEDDLDDAADMSDPPATGVKCVHIYSTKYRNNLTAHIRTRHETLVLVCN